MTSPKPLDRYLQNFTRMFRWWSYFKLCKDLLPYKPLLLMAFTDKLFFSHSLQFHLHSLSNFPRYLLLIYYHSAIYTIFKVFGMTKQGIKPSKPNCIRPNRTISTSTTSSLIHCLVLF